MVSNTGPVIALAQLDLLGVLQALCREVLVPEQVHQEILAGGSHGVGIDRYRRAGWIKVLPVSLSADPLLTTILDRGEAAVIMLAREKNAECVLIDERKARTTARSVYNLGVIGTARLFVEAKKIGVLESVYDTLRHLSDCGYWIHEDIVHRAAAEAGEEI
ncbi:MAG: hypothetical protein R6V85_18455 [Polyangia bacterium]